MVMTSVSFKVTGVSWQCARRSLSMVMAFDCGTYFRLWIKVKVNFRVKEK